MHHTERKRLMRAMPYPPPAALPDYTFTYDHAYAAELMRADMLRQAEELRP